MKFFYLPIFILSLISVISALPVDISLTPGTKFQLRDELPAVEPEMVDLGKRDIAALTALFKAANNSATIELVKVACQNLITSQQIIKFVANLIEEKNLTSLLQAADESGLGLDIVLLVLTHYEVFPGLTDIVKQYKGESTSSSSDSNSTSSSSLSSSSSSGGLLGGLLSGVGSILGLGGSSSSSSTSATASGYATATASGASATSATATTTSSSGGLLGGLLSGVGSLFGLGGSSSSSSVITAATATTAATNTAAVGTGVAAAAATATLVATVATTDSGLAGLLAGTETTATATTATVATRTSATSAATTSSTSLSGGILGTVTSLLGSLKREDLEDLLMSAEFHEVLRKRDVPVDNMLSEYTKRSIEDPEMAKRDLLDTLYQLAISIIGTDSNIEEIAESLAKSGLAINVLYNALTDDGFFDFDVKLVKYLVEKGLISWLLLLDALWKSGLLVSIAGDIIGNSSYIRLVINLIIATFTGEAKVIPLLLAFF